ncbi:hypothetical protein AB0L13_11125 [Saccharopolyspora shandongensis]|uniref:hypothetical protein n=1 Tax=Saccharopolyspora shandongensis TaxID=418495 RepID=UPI003448B879
MGAIATSVCAPVGGASTSVIDVLPRVVGIPALPALRRPPGRAGSARPQRIGSVGRDLVLGLGKSALHAVAWPLDCGLTRACSRVAVLPEDRIFEPSGVALFM